MRRFLIPMAIFLSISSCVAYPQKKNDYEIKNNAMKEYPVNCNYQEEQSPFFENFPCEDEILPRTDVDEWIEDNY